MLKSNTHTIWVSIFFTFLCIFPTLRFLIVGRDSTTVFDYCISALPDIFSVGIIFIFGFHFFTHKQIRFNTADYLFISYLLFSIVYGAILSKHTKACLLGFRISYFPMLFYFVGKSFNDTSDSFSKKILQPIFTISAIVGVLGFVLYFFTPDWNMKIVEEIEGVINEYLIVRMTSIFWTPVVFGTTMGFALLYFLHQYFTSEKISKLTWFFITFCWFGLVLSVSRGPIICFVLMLLFYYFIFKNRKKIIHISVVLILLYAVSILFASLQQQMLYNGGNFFALFYNMVNFTIKSAAETATITEGLTRVELWRRSWQSFTENVWGYGLGKSGHIAWRLFKDTNIPSSAYSTDGWYLKLLGETGIPGAVYFSALLGYFIFKIKQAKFLKNKSITIFFVAIFLFGLIQNIVSNVFDYYFIAPIFYIILGYSSNLFYDTKG